MIVAHANSGIDAFHAALTSADTQLEHISTRLQSELSLNHPNSSTNPYSLLQRLRTLQTDLPALREQLLTIHQQKAELVSTCRTDLEENTAFARRVLPIATPAGSSPVSLGNELDRTNNCLNTLLADFRKVNSGFVERTDVRDKELSLALLRAVADVNITSNEDMKENSPEEEDVERTVKSSRVAEKPAAKSGAKPKAGKLRKTTSGDKKIVVTKPPKTEFEPISKVVYNRLPRVLKIKAGKLPEVNEFYKTVFGVLCDASSPMSDAELRKATGEDSMTKFDVLRGLAVVRRGKQGWMLAG